MFVSIHKVWAKLFTFLSIKICSVAYGGILLPDILDYFRILTTRGGKYSVSSASRDRVIITHAYPVLNQIRAYHYAYIRFSILERSILQANIDIPRILIYACIPYCYLNYVYKAIIKFMKT